MGKELTKAIIAKEWAKASFGHFDNRCDKCGKRLKLQPGGLIAIAPRFTTCRSCGYDNPSLSEIVAERLRDQGYNPEILGVDESLLPQCLQCEVELQVSKDFTKVFCQRCAKEWSLPDFEDILERPLSPSLAGRIPIQPDDSKHAKELVSRLEEKDIDFSTIYFVAPIQTPETAQKEASPSKPRSNSLFKAFSDGFKEGFSDEKNSIEVTSEKLAKKASFVAVFDDYIARYDITDDDVKVQESQFSHIFHEDKETIDEGLSLVFLSGKDQKKFTLLINDFRNIYLANKNPYKEVLFGTAKIEANKNATKPTVGEGETLADQLMKLSELKNQGILSEEEFAAAKAKILNQ